MIVEEKKDCNVQSKKKRWLIPLYIIHCYKYFINFYYYVAYIIF